MGEIDYESLFNEIISDISEGMPVRKALRGRISNGKFYDMLEEDVDREKRYARACAQRADIIFEESLEIADDSNEDITYKDGVAIENQKVVQRDRLRVETRKWFLSKLHPKKYGDKSEIDLRVKENVQPVINFIKNGTD